MMKGGERKTAPERGWGTALLHNILTFNHFSVLFGQTFPVIRAIWLSNQIQNFIVKGLKRVLYLLIALKD